MASKGKAKRGGKGEVRDIPLLEWVAAGIGVAIVAAMLLLLVNEALRSHAIVPPMMRVQPVRIVSGNGEYVVEVEVGNHSRKTGANVTIEGQLRRGGASVETSGTTLDYVPGQSHRPAGLVFTHDPRQYQLQLRVTGYERP